jgi:hypothetical protein
MERVDVKNCWQSDHESERCRRTSTTQPGPGRGHLRANNDSSDDDEDAPDHDKPHLLYLECRCRDNDGQDDGADHEPVEIHSPGEEATDHHNEAVPHIGIGQNGADERDDRPRRRE